MGARTASPLLSCAKERQGEAGTLRPCFAISPAIIAVSGTKQQTFGAPSLVRRTQNTCPDAGIILPFSQERLRPLPCRPVRVRCIVTTAPRQTEMAVVSSQLAGDLSERPRRPFSTRSKTEADNAAAPALSIGIRRRHTRPCGVVIERPARSIAIMVAVCSRTAYGPQNVFCI